MLHNACYFLPKRKNKQKNTLLKKGDNMAVSFASMNEDLLENILSRLPALPFASAACVNKSWNRVCNRILSKPMLASALSLKPSLLDAVTEVLDKVLSQPIRPHFAIAFVGRQLYLAATHQLITRRLGSRIPIITNAATGIIGLDAHTNELEEVKWQAPDAFGQYNLAGGGSGYLGVVLVVGFVPGLKVDTIPLLRSKQTSQRPQEAMVDKFMMDIRHYTASVSDCTSPKGIIMFGNRRFDLKLVLVEMDYGLPEETVIVGDASGRFLFTSAENSQSYDGNSYFVEAVALVFARDSRKSDVTGEIQFNVTMSTGVTPFGPVLNAVEVQQPNAEFTFLTAKMEGEDSIIDSVGLIQDIIDEINDENAKLYIGVRRQRELSTGSSRSYLTFYEVLGGERGYFAVGGVGIKPGDSFLFYHSDSEAASCSSDSAFEDLKILKAATSDQRCTTVNDHRKVEVFGGLIFSSSSRCDSEAFSRHIDIESSPFYDNFPEIPLAGVFCAGEIRRGGSLRSLIKLDEEEENCPISGRCLLHRFSTIYLVMSYTDSTTSPSPSMS